MGSQNIAPHILVLQRLQIEAVTTISRALPNFSVKTGYRTFKHDTIRKAQLISRNLRPIIHLGMSSCSIRARKSNSLGYGLLLCMKLYWIFTIWSKQSKIYHPRGFERNKEKQKLPLFLHGLWQSFTRLVESIWEADRNGQYFNVNWLKPLRTLFWAFHQLATEANFDRAVFQTYLKMLTSTTAITLPDVSILSQGFSTTLSKQITAFGSDVQLVTGLSMDRLWHAFKPPTPKSQTQLQAIIELETLADRLDVVMWKSHISFDGMIQVRERVISSLDLLRQDEIDASELITSLSLVMQDLEQGANEYSTVTTPYFEEEFEGICQFLDVLTSNRTINDSQHSTFSHNAIALRTRSAALARRPTKLQTVAFGHIVHPSSYFARLSRYLGLKSPSQKSLVAKRQFHTGLLSKLYGASEIHLAQLDSFETELQVLSQGLSKEASCLMADQNEALNSIYHELYHQMYSSHAAEVIETHEKGKITFYPEAQMTDKYRSLLQSGFMRCYRPDGEANGKAWIELGLLGISLYVPNYPHDPALQPMIERKMFIEEKQSLQAKIDVLRQFQIAFTGQETSFSHAIYSANNTGHGQRTTCTRHHSSQDLTTRRPSRRVHQLAEHHRTHRSGVYVY